MILWDKKLFARKKPAIEQRAKVLGLAPVTVPKKGKNALKKRG